MAAILATVIKRGAKLRKRFKARSVPPMLYQKKTLKRLLKKASNTAFGQHYDFKQLLKAEDFHKQFQENVPIFDYNSLYEQWWHRTINQEANVCWPGKVKYFAMSSGTSGAPSKYIPVTPDIIRANQRASARIYWYLPNYDVPDTMYGKPSMLLGGTVDLEDMGGYFVGDLSGINGKKIPFWYRSFCRPGAKIASVKDWNKRIDKIAENAPKWDIGLVGGIPAWVQLMMERIIDRHNLDTIHDIWPNLAIYVTGGVAFEPYRKGFNRLTATPLKYIDTYLASEGFIAIQTRPETRAMALILNNGNFYEFIPFNSQNFDSEGNIIGKPQALTIDQVEEGVDYALLLSTCAGTWRYLIGDTIRFTDLERNEIIITGRTQHFLSICGEHMSVANMNQAIEMVEDELNIDIREFTVAGIEYDNFFAHKWYLGTDTTLNKTLLAKKIDEKLKILNADYATERSAVLNAVLVEVVPSKLFYKWHESKGKLGGQNKFPRVLSKERFKAWETFVEKHHV